MVDSFTIIFKKNPLQISLNQASTHEKVIVLQQQTSCFDEPLRSLIHVSKNCWCPGLATTHLSMEGHLFPFLFFFDYFCQIPPSTYLPFNSWGAWFDISRLQPHDFPNPSMKWWCPVLRAVCQIWPYASFPCPCRSSWSGTIASSGRSSCARRLQEQGYSDPCLSAWWCLGSGQGEIELYFSYRPQICFLKSLAHIKRGYIAGLSIMFIIMHVYCV